MFTRSHKFLGGLNKSSERITEKQSEKSEAKNYRFEELLPEDWTQMTRKNYELNDKVNHDRGVSNIT